MSFEFPEILEFKVGLAGLIIAQVITVRYIIWRPIKIRRQICSGEVGRAAISYCAQSLILNCLQRFCYLFNIANLKIFKGMFLGPRWFSSMNKQMLKVSCYGPLKMKKFQKIVALSVWR